MAKLGMSIITLLEFMERSQGIRGCFFWFIASRFLHPANPCDGLMKTGILLARARIEGPPWLSPKAQKPRGQ